MQPATSTVVVTFVAALMPSLRMPPQVPLVMAEVLVEQSTCRLPTLDTISFPSAERFWVGLTITPRQATDVHFARATQSPPLAFVPSAPSGVCSQFLPASPAFPRSSVVRSSPLATLAPLTRIPYWPLP